MKGLWLKVRGFVAAGVALVACRRWDTTRHLVVTLPLLLSLTAGTVIGAFLRQNAWLAYGVSTVVFVVSLFLVFRWLDQPSGDQLREV